MKKTGMNVRQVRLTRIRAIVQSMEIGSQEELARALAKEGFVLTQSALSRDLKLLKVVKGIGTGGRPVYMLPENPYYHRVREHRLANHPSAKGAATLRVSGQLAIIKCRPGYASGLASDIDNAGFQGIIGTIAGDDTIFMALEEGCDKAVLEHELRTIVPLG